MHLCRVLSCPGMKLLPIATSYPIGVVAYQTQCSDANIKSLDSSLRQIIETNLARLAEEDIPATPPTQHHRINAARLVLHALAAIFGSLQFQIQMYQACPDTTL